MQIIDAANITDKEKQIVLTAVDYSKKMNAAVLDCALSRNVMGKVWKGTFIASFSPNERNA